MSSMIIPRALRVRSTVLVHQRPCHQSFRALSTTFSCLAKPPPPTTHPTQHEDRNVQSGKPVAEFAKEDETKVSGLPEEPKEGGPPPPLAGKTVTELFSLSNRTVIVTGAARGLGLTIAHSLLDAGANVVAIDRTPEPADEPWSDALKLASSKGLKLSYHSLDITDQASVSSLFENLFASAPESAPVRGMFHAAGIQLLMSALEFPADKFRGIIDVNINGSFFVSQAFAREYLKWKENKTKAKAKAVGNEEDLDGASIVLTGSMSGHVANFGLECAAYNASKAGVNQLVKNLAMEWGKQGIRVNSLSPGYIRSAMTAQLLAQKPELDDIWHRGSLLGRLSTPDEFRGPVLYMLSDASSFMTGADLLVDGGHTAT
ncbi:hypothetical protein BCR39DRAFT_524944 [Naematelia encephala]|uniref:Ketoreductase domain-containing protein n=1 Tax=Naematelia encephala TaxID=71784 RepID=A0A1Y2BD48_9TREE|nr:hypothetical protein BCR39DRAFT_524944 [Naematelia encephala]